MMKAPLLTIALLGALCALASATVLFSEDFSGDWDSRWVQSQSKSDYGKFVATAGEYYGDAEKDTGIQTSQDARFYALSTKFDTASNEGKTLVLQFSVKHEQKIDCGGGYVKILRAGFDAEDFNGETPYNVMFGPDICGSTKRIHLIFNYGGENLLWKRTINCETDVHNHVYTMIVNADNTYAVLVDNDEKASGSLEEDWDFLAPKTIPDPEDKKPADWVDEAEIVDPEDAKPEGWDDEPAQIVDPDAEKPEDWDDELDGEWEAPMIDNPEYQGEWTPRMIPNPDYKGPWAPREIPNPDYKEDPNLYLHNDMGGAGFDLWQVKSGTIFDNILITDDVEEAKAAAEEILALAKVAKEAYTAKQEEERAAAAAAAEDADEDEEFFEDDMEDFEEEAEEEVDEEEVAAKEAARQSKLEKLKAKAAEKDEL